MSIETLNLIETLLHNELMSAVANKDKNEILKLSAAWLETATELEKKYYSSVPVEPAATVKVVEDIFGEPKWFPCLSYTQLQSGDKVEFINDRGITVQDVVARVGSEHIILMGSPAIQKRIISRFCPIQQQ